jgi:hypothetical protein
MIHKLRESIKKLKSEGVESQAIPFKQFKMGRTGIIEQPA